MLAHAGLHRRREEWALLRVGKALSYLHRSFSLVKLSLELRRNGVGVLAFVGKEVTSFGQEINSWSKLSTDNVDLAAKRTIRNHDKSHSFAQDLSKTGTDIRQKRTISIPMTNQALTACHNNLPMRQI